MGFRHYNQNQLVLFPHTFEDLISSEHPVRIVNDVLEKINISKLLSAYRKEGNPSYHPVMMLKVMVFAYMENIYSSRKIEKAMRENVLFMWLSNMNIADHNTIARFRSQKLQSAFKDIFTQVVLLLAEEGLITLKQVYTDGTKIEAQANRYTFVWENPSKPIKKKCFNNLKNFGLMPKASLRMKIQIRSRRNLKKSVKKNPADR
jgi:transposase